MTECIPIIIPIICFVVGLAIGVAVTIVGFRLGWKASYEIRMSKGDDSVEDKGLFGARKDPAEFELLDDEKEKEMAE